MPMISPHRLGNECDRLRRATQACRPFSHIRPSGRSSYRCCCSGAVTLIEAIAGVAMIGLIAGVAVAVALAVWSATVKAVVAADAKSVAAAEPVENKLGVVDAAATAVAAAAAAADAVRGVVVVVAAAAAVVRAAVEKHRGPDRLLAGLGLGFVPRTSFYYVTAPSAFNSF